jgi:hypothetical protein
MLEYSSLVWMKTHSPSFLSPFVLVESLTLPTNNAEKRREFDDDDDSEDLFLFEIVSLFDGTKKPLCKPRRHLWSSGKITNAAWVAHREASRTLEAGKGVSFAAQEGTGRKDVHNNMLRKVTTVVSYLL